MTEVLMHGALTNRVIGDPDRRSILVVDDEETIRLALTRFLTSRGYDVDSADSGLTALAALERRRYTLMLCDVRMPGLTGLELVPRAVALDPDLAIVMLTAVNDAPTASEVLAQGAMDYLMKPIELPELLRALERVIERRSLAIEQRNVEDLIGEEVTRRSQSLERQRVDEQSLTVDAFATLIAAFEAKDVCFRGNSARVTALSVAIADELRLPAAERELLRTAALVHDIGRVYLRESVVNKPGALTAVEFDHVKEHVRLGLEILAPLAFLRPVLTTIRDHHEHWDGSGYPGALMGEQISIGGRVLSAADAFVALTSQRPHRPAMAVEATIAFLASHSGGLLDPAIYAALKTVVLERKVLGFAG